MLIKIIALFLITVTSAFAYTPPTGIPTPTWGLNDTLPGRPADWSSEVTGYYYIDFATGNDSGRTYGTPSAPRKTIPNPIVKGSRIEINGEYNYSSAGRIRLYGATDATAPNGNAWSAGSDGPAWLTMTDSNSFFSTYSVTLTGSYIYMDSVKTGGATAIMVNIGNDIVVGYRDTDHIMIRNSSLNGNGSTHLNAVQAVGGIQSKVAQYVDNVIFYNNTFTNIGDMTATTDLENCALFIGPYISYVWALKNTVTNVSNHAIFVGGQTGVDQDLTHHIYFGENTIHDCNISGIFAKNCQNVVMSSNTIYNINDSGHWGDRGKCFGAQYGPDTVWLINNTCYHTTYGLYVGSNDSGHAVAMYLVGNVFYDINRDYADLEKYAGTYPTYSNRPESAVMIASAGTFTIVNNTFNDVSSGVSAPSGTTIDIEGNIIANLNQSGGYVTALTPSVSTITMATNDLYGVTSTKMRMDNADYADLAAFIAGGGTCTNCIATDPVLVGGTNVHLQSSSPAIGATTEHAAYQAFYDAYTLSIKTDGSGYARPQGGSWDIGAYEYKMAAQSGQTYSGVSLR
jgi:hypothetical protein